MHSYALPRALTDLPPHSYAPSGIERTWNFKQEEIVKVVDASAARKAFDLSLPELGPYSLDFTRSGRFMLLGGEKGHLALMDWQRSQLVAEVQVRETTRDVKFLHNETFFAAAQKKYVYIYDKRGIEIHCLRDHVEANTLEFLPHHFLLASIGDAGEAAAARRTPPRVSRRDCDSDRGGLAACACEGGLDAQHRPAQCR